MLNIVITGGSSGLGRCIVDAMHQNNNIFNWSLDQGVDVRSAVSVHHAAQKLPSKIDILINCAGINKINFMPHVSPVEWDEVMDTNVRGIFRVSQALLEHLRDGTVLNIVSNAAHVPMTASAAYNASKGAALMLTKQMARELGKTHNICVFSISPNKLAGTNMSRTIEQRVCELRGWTPEQAQAYQLAALPAGEETDPKTLAEFIGFLLSSKQRHKYLAGCDIPYGGP